MTEAEWLACPHPAVMGNMLRREENVRRLRLFACACCRRAWHHLDEASRQAIGVAERYGDGLATDEELAAAENAAKRASYPFLAQATEEADRLRRAAEAVREACLPSSGDRLSICDSLNTHLLSTVLAPERERELPGLSEFKDDERRWAGIRASYNRPGESFEAAIQADLLRDIFGNPFRPVAADPTWLTSTVVALAQGIYDERAFDRMPILADALQDAGCDNDDILNHCRGDGPHVRGCWVVDLVLGKS